MHTIRQRTAITVAAGRVVLPWRRIVAGAMCTSLLAWSVGAAAQAPAPVSIDYSVLEQSEARTASAPLLVPPPGVKAATVKSPRLVLKPPAGVPRYVPGKIKPLKLSLRGATGINAIGCDCPPARGSVIKKRRTKARVKAATPAVAVAPAPTPAKPAVVAPPAPAPMPAPAKVEPPKAAPPAPAPAKTAPTAAPAPAPAKPAAASVAAPPPAPAKPAVVATPAPAPVPAPQRAAAPTAPVAPPAAPPAAAPKPPQQVAAVPAPQVLTPPPRPVAPAAAPVAPPPAPVTAAAPAAKPAEPPKVEPPKPETQVAAIPAAPKPTETQKTDAPLSILYTTGSQIPADAATGLKDVTQRLAANPALRVQLLSYASDPEKNVSRSRRLSLERAVAVRKLLIDNGLDSTRIEVRALGDQNAGGAPDRVDVIVSPRR